MPAGRPTKFKAEHCDKVVELGKRGYSRVQIAAHFDVSRATIDNWAEQHPEFLEAITRAKVHEQAWWEAKGMDGLDADKFNAPVWKKSMEARFRDDYTERREVTGKDGTDLVPDTDPRQLARAIVAVLGSAAIEDDGE